MTILDLKTNQEINRQLFTLKQSIKSFHYQCFSVDIQNKIKLLKRQKSIVTHENYGDRCHDVLKAFDETTKALTESYNRALIKETRQSVDKIILNSRNSKRQLAFQEFNEAGLML
jgi:hypothetical protein